MSNRKYAAAVLTDNDIPVEKQMDSVCTIMAEIMDIATREIIKKTPIEAIGSTDSFQSYLNMKYKDMFPELHKKYEVIIGTVPDEDKWKVVVGWRKRLHPLRDAPYYSFSPFRESGIHHMTFPQWHQGNDGAGTGLDVDMLDGYHADGFIRGDDQVRLDGLIDFVDVPTPAPEEINTHRIMQQIRRQIEEISYGYDGFQLQNNHEAVHAIAAQASNMLQGYQDMGIIQDFRLNAVTTPQGHPDLAPEVQFTITPNQTLERVNISVSLRP